ncbi:MAG TPA: alpha/beta fold hydrolase [Pirellulales bacterium]|nr:alpha/beta fold hydrolase [Pirellulales bacterium]
MEIFELPNFRLQSGETLPHAQVAYQTYGQLNAAKSNAILYPTSYGAHHTDIEWVIGPDGILDSSRYFVIIPNMFGNGLSTSPSNLGDAWGDKPWPTFTHIDNVAAQRRLLAEVFGIQRLALVYGWSMGGQQALHWGALHPEQVERIAALCSSAKTSVHNRVFLEGLQATLTADTAWNGTHFTGKPDRGLRAMGRVYAGWALSQAFYREQLYREIGYASLEDFLVRDWEASFLRRDAGNLLSMIETWKRSDISDNDRFGGDLRRALASIQARTLIMPSATDLYFTAADAQAESQHIPHAQFRSIPSIWGHRAGNPLKNPADAAFIKAAVAELLDS